MEKVSSSLKLATIIMLYKKDDPAPMKNYYRPISLLNVFSRIIECAVAHKVQPLT